MNESSTTLNYDTEIATVENRPGLLRRLFARSGMMRAQLLARFRTFGFRGQRLKYFIASYNMTWVNERCVELAVIEHLLPAKGDVLEIGNVWGHYREHDHTVVDKYEVAERVMNCDVVEIPLETKYDFIFSISTFEHVGWDELPQEPEKLAAALLRVRGLLKPEGVAVITIPVGWNDWLDTQLREQSLDVNEVEWIVRKGSVCNWEAADATTALETQYGSPRPHANGVGVLFLRSQKP